MLGSKVATVILLGAGLGGWACGTTTDVFTTGSGGASVAGRVTRGGAPIAAATIRINCDGAAPVFVTADSAGNYGVSLVTSEQTFDVRGGQVPCHFTEPALGAPRAEVDKVVGFARGPVLRVLQLVDLRE